MTAEPVDVCVDVLNAFQGLSCNVATYSQMGPDLPSRAQIRTEWADNKSEAGGPF